MTGELELLRAAIQTLENAEAAPGAEAQASRARAVQQLLLCAVRLYASDLERDAGLPAFPPGEAIPSATEALMVVTAILDAVQVEPFELGLWATWGVRGFDREGGG